MNADELRALQAPLKARFREHPETAMFTVRAEGRLGEGVSCRIGTAKGEVTAGLHPIAGGSGLQACSGDMLLEALVACAGVTMKAVAIALNIPLRDGTVFAEGDIDSRGTLGVAKDAPVGFQRIRLKFQLDTDAPPEQVATLIKMTERYCVILQTLAHPPEVSVASELATG
jgi:uncharacterized OsmC-like protein